MKAPFGLAGKINTVCLRGRVYINSVAEVMRRNQGRSDACESDPKAAVKRKKMEGVRSMSVTLLLYKLNLAIRVRRK
jgi:hypothetical protein